MAWSMVSGGWFGNWFGVAGLGGASAPSVQSEKSTPAYVCRFCLGMLLVKVLLHVFVSAVVVSALFYPPGTR